MLKIILGFFVPFLGTVIGASTVFFMKDELSNKFEQLLLGFAGGVMLSASIWSLLSPAIEQSKNITQFAYLGVIAGFLIGIIFLIVIEIVSSAINKGANESTRQKHKKTGHMMLAITIHNIPEGMAVGVALAGVLNGLHSLTMAGAFSLAMGIAIQNFPDGAIVSMPLYADGYTKRKAFIMGVLSGVLELVSAILAFFLTKIFASILPYILAFASGATMFVVVKDLIPSSQNGEHTNLATFAFTLGFILMVLLDIALN